MVIIFWEFQGTIKKAGRWAEDLRARKTNTEGKGRAILTIYP